MKKVVSVLFFSFFVSVIAFGQSKEDKEKALEYGKEAIKLMDNEGDYDGAIKLLEKSEKLDPKNIIYAYEIAYALYSQKKYDAAIKRLKKITSHKDATDQHFQLLGNSYDIIGKPDEAIETYKEGLKKFPNSGKLYLEQGIVEYFRKNYDESIRLWEEGVKAEPTFSSNYYWLGKIFSYTEERIWSVMYGEIFINLERNTDRTIEMSEILFNTYKEAIIFSSDTSSEVRFSKRTTIDVKSIKDEFKMPFNLVFGLEIINGMLPKTLSGETTLTIAILNDIRHTFIENWYEGKRDKDYPNPLFDFQKKLLDSGHFETYNYWFLMKGDTDEFKAWYDKNKDKFSAFATWMNDNEFNLDKKNYFIRE